jgi:hypothetical protein
MRWQEGIHPNMVWEHCHHDDPDFVSYQQGARTAVIEGRLTARQLRDLAKLIDSCRGDSDE